MNINIGIDIDIDVELDIDIDVEIDINIDINVEIDIVYLHVYVSKGIMLILPQFSAPIFLIDESMQEIFNFPIFPFIPQSPCLFKGIGGFRGISPYPGYSDTATSWSCCTFLHPYYVLAGVCNDFPIPQISQAI